MNWKENKAVKKYYFVTTKTENNKHFASVIKVLENENVPCALNIDGIQSANHCPTRVSAEALAEQWNTQYKNNGTYLYS